MDIQEIFKEKNKEILITNLKYDLDKNIGSLMETITNIVNLEFDTALKKIEAIFLDSNIDYFNKDLVDIINNMKIDSFEIIEKNINDKKNIVLNSIQNLTFQENDMNKYYDMILNTTKDLKERLNIQLKLELDKYSTKLGNQINEENNRLEDYLNDRLYGKLETKIHMEIMLRDNNLINKAKEGYLRYQEICSKTEEN